MCRLHNIEPALLPLAVPIADLRPDPDNARTHSRRALAAVRASLAAFGQQKPIVVDAAGRVVAGHATLAGARALGWTHIAAVRTRLTGHQRAAFAIADNRTAELSDWNQSMVAAQLAALREAPDIDALVTGFSAPEIDKWTGGRAAAYSAPELPRILQVLVDCPDESAQRRIYDLATAAGCACRVLTL